MKTTIWVNTSFIGFHQWPEAPDEVKYLRDLHRHTFNVKVNVSVSHGDRDVEFHILKQSVQRALDLLGLSLKATPRLSCENMAEYLYMQLRDEYAVRSIGVDEDGECGAVISF